MDLRACPRCASLDLHGQTLREGLVVGTEGLATVCAECGFQGAPLLFAAREDYEAFRADRRGPPGAERSARETAAAADAEAEAAEEEARAHPQPLPPGLETEPDLLDRLRLVPVLVFAVGAVCLVVGLFTLGLARVFAPAVPLTNGPVGLPLALLGLGLMLVAHRLWVRASARAVPRP